MNTPLRGFRQRREAQALQDALERYERALAEGIDPGQARVGAGRGLGELSSPFALATSMADAASDITPDPAFARRVAMQIREAPVVRREVARREVPRFRLAPFAAAAAVLVAALVLIPSFGSLPGEPLYAVKGAAEEARVWFASGPREARIRLSLANERFEEVEELIDNSRVRVMGGPGLLAAGVNMAEIDDPDLARLIEEALRNAGEQLEAAAQILTEAPAPQEDLDSLVAVTTRGRTLATSVADELPNGEQRPVLRAVVKLAKIEAKAKAAQTSAQDVAPTPEPCPTPSASPSPSPTPAQPDGTPTASPSPTLTPGIDETQPTPSPTPEPSATPSSDPCATAEPTATPSPTPASEGTEASTEPSPTAQSEEQASTVDENDEGEPSSVSEEPRESHRHPLSPFGERA